MSRRNFSLLLIFLIFSLACYWRNEQNPHARYVSEGYEQIDRLALHPPADEELVAGAMKGMVDVLRRRGDEHSTYFRKTDAQRYREDLRGDFGGIGVRFNLQGEPPLPTVIGPPEPGGPAFDAGMKPEDRIVSIDGVLTEGMTIKDVGNLIRGDVGEEVVLSLKRAGSEEPITVRLLREIIETQSVLGDRRMADGSWRHLLEQDRRIALVRIESFGDKTFDELKRLLPELIKLDAKALVIDLRGNPGGALDIAVEICNLFLPPGKDIVETRGRNEEVDDRYVATGGPYTGVPMAVLINGGSASASEIMAACLQDNKRAVIVGQRSFGKGTVQHLIEMGPGQSMLKLTAASFWRPSGVDIHRAPGADENDLWGVKPDPGYEVELTKEEYEEFYKARADRDLMPIDMPKDAGELQVDQDQKAPSEPQGEEHLDHGEKQQEEAPFTDRVLDRAIEHLQSLLDGSVSVKVAVDPAS